MSDTNHDGLRLSSQAEQDEASPVEIFKRVHRLLRGRYPLAIALAVVCGGIGGFVGFTSQTPQYQSTGKIHVKPMLGKILDDTEMSSLMPMFRNYVNTQAALLQSQRVVDRAMQSDEWRALGRGITPVEKEAFVKSLHVRVDNHSGQLIDVSFFDPEPKAALVGAREVVRAYRDIHALDERLDDPQRVNVLREKQRMLENEIERRRTLMQTIAEQYGTIDLTERHENDLEYLFQLEAMQRQLQIELDKAETRAAGGVDDTPSIAQDVDVAQIASVDPQMAMMLQERRQYQARLDQLRAKGLSDLHRDVKRAIGDLKSMDTQITDYKHQWIVANGGPNGVDLGITSTGDPEQIEAQLKLVTSRLGAWRQQTIELGRDRQRIEQLIGENEHDQAELERVEERLDQITTESKIQEFSGVSGRISILSEGTMSTSPAIDRRAKMALAGVVVGGGAPVALLMLLGLVGSRFRYSDETKGQIHAPLLGILPTLPDNLTDPEEASVAAHCVHQIRTLLQIGVDRDHTPVYAVTSPTAGDGKTSLALSMGFSFAASGARTLLIDFDMIGGGMSTALKMREESGVLDAIAAGTIDGHVRTTWVDRLSLLPIGHRDGERVGQLSPAAVKKLIADARDKFEVVVADTGPILGSLEASMLGAEADGVVLVLGRGQTHANSTRAFDQLRAVRARVMGVVFNRAKSADVKRSMSSASIRSMPADGSESNVLKLDSEQAKLLDGLGPMPRTIAASVGKVA